MIKTDSTGNSVLSYEVMGKITRIPLERRGTTKRGVEWTLGSCLLEVYEDGKDGSARLFLVTFDTELIETLNIIGVGKIVKARYHIDVRDRYDGYSVSLILDEVSGLTDGEDFLYGKPKKK